MITVPTAAAGTGLGMCIYAMSRSKYYAVPIAGIVLNSIVTLAAAFFWMLLAAALYHGGRW